MDGHAVAHGRRVVVPAGADGDLPAATSRDTVRSRSFSGQAVPARLKNDWTDAWEADDTPDPLPMPLQMLVAIEAVSRGSCDPVQAKDVFFNPCGQVIGRATQVRKAKDVVDEMVEEYIEATERLLKPGSPSDRQMHG